MPDLEEMLGMLIQIMTHAVGLTCAWGSIRALETKAVRAHAGAPLQTSPNVVYYFR